MFDFFQKKNHALAPLQNVDFFWTFPELHFSGLKKHFFLFKIKKKKFFFWLSLFKKTCKKKKPIY